MPSSSFQQRPGAGGMICDRLGVASDGPAGKISLEEARIYFVDTWARIGSETGGLKDFRRKSLRGRRWFSLSALPSIWRAMSAVARREGRFFGVFNSLKLFKKVIDEVKMKRFF